MRPDTFHEERRWLMKTNKPKARRMNASVERLRNQRRPLLYKDMSRQCLAPDVRNAFVQRIKRASTRLLRKYPEVEELNLMVEWQKEIIIAEDGTSDGADTYYEVYYFAPGGGGFGFGASAVHAFAENGKGDAGYPMELVEAPDAVLAQVLETFDDFVAAIERAIRGALFLYPEDRPNGPERKTRDSSQA
jgi:hypothetical protein